MPTTVGNLFSCTHSSLGRLVGRSLAGQCAVAPYLHTDIDGHAWTNSCSGDSTGTRKAADFVIAFDGLWIHVPTDPGSLLCW